MALVLMKVLDASIHFTVLLLAISLYPWGKDKADKALRWMLLYLVVTGIFDFCASLIQFHVLPSPVPRANFFIYHILTPIQYIVIVGLYYNLTSNARMKWALLISLPVILISVVVITIEAQRVDKYNSYGAILKYLMTIVWILFYLKEILDKQYFENILREPAFWVSAGLLIYSLGNIFVEGFANYLLKNGDYFDKFYLVYSGLNYLLFATIATGFICFKLNDKSANT